MFAVTLSSSVTARAAASGVTADKIVIGESAAFSGPAQALGKAMREGALAYFNEVNRNGGVNGRRIELVSLDDGYEPDRAVANTRKLIDEQKVFALFGYVGTPTSYAVMPMVTEAKIPFLGAFTGAERLRNPVNRYIFNIRASYFDETERLVDWEVKDRKARIAVFYQDDAYGKAGLEGVKRAMDRRNLAIVALGTVQRNTVDVPGAVKSIHAAKPDAVIMISAYKSCAAFIKEMQKLGSGADFLNVSFVGSAALAKELGPSGNGVIISQVMPYPYDPTSGAAMELRNLFELHSPDKKSSFNNVEGYVAAKTLVEGLRNAGPELTRARLIAALERFRNVDMGGFPVTFTPTDHSGSKYVGLTIIVGDGQFIPLEAHYGGGNQLSLKK